MKKKYFIGVLLFLVAISYAQNVTFSDIKFKTKLLTSSTANQVAKDLNGNFFKIDANNDGEIQVTEAIQVSYIDIRCSSCSDAQKANSIGGINDFINLKTFKLSFQSVDNIEISGLSQLEEIDASNNQTVQLTVNGVTNLKILNLSGGNLTAIDATVFPSLEELQCSYNNNLSTINVAGLSLLKSLMCGYTMITQLNLTGLTSLEALFVNNAPIASLDLTQISNLQELYCWETNITALNFSTQTNMKRFTSYGNSIGTIDLSGFPNLEYVYCPSSGLTSLNVSGATNLKYLNCSQNQISTLNLSGLFLLEQLYCATNQISTLDLTGMTVLKELYCNNNLLTSVDTNDCAMLEVFTASNNPQLQYALFKNGSNEFEMDLTNTPNLLYACGDDFDVAQLEFQVSATCHVNTYCSFIPGGTFYTINGTTRLDENNNGCDAPDAVIPNFKFSITNGTSTGTLISNDSGNNSIPVQVGTHTITPILENPNYFTVSPATSSVSFPALSSPFIQNFCVSPNGIHNDLEISAIPQDNARPGFNSNCKIIYKNKGTQTQSGSISFAFNDAALDLINANPIVSSQAINALNWNFTNLQPFETREITLTLNLNSPMEIPPVNGGDVLNFTASVNSSLIDETPDDNTFTLNQTVVNSFDPNDKTCLEGNTITPEMVGKDVHYLIRFENTGTANAENVVVKDMIDTTKFDINSLIPIDGSHSFVTRISNTNKVEFIFENINLPFDDANNDGYVAFKIKTKPTLVVGDSFSNTASIYFDYNFPIITDPAVTTVALLANSDFEFENYFSIYPNPANTILNIETKRTIAVTSINIYNTLGQIVLVIPNAEQTQSVDVSSLKTGNYLMKVNSDKGSSSVKFVKM
jgi:uncharacterized repeat protein (TIGR01451 family)